MRTVPLVVRSRSELALAMSDQGVVVPIPTVLLETTSWLVPTVRPLGTSESLPALLKVEVAVEPNPALLKTDSCVIEAPAPKICSALQVFWDEVETLLFPPPPPPATMPSDEVETRLYPPLPFPRSNCPNVGEFESPVPPYAIEIVLVEGK
jgi:hypothetical protein